MQRWLTALVLILLTTLASVFPLPVLGTSPSIMVAGQGPDTPSGREQALQEAEQKAITQALARMITPSTDEHSIFQQLRRQYTDYIAGKPEILRTQKKEGTIILFVRVPVDYNKLQQHLTQDISTLQQSDAHSDDAAYFFVRVTGVSSPQEHSRSQAEVLNFYTDSFQQYGFQKGSADDILIQNMQQHAALPYDAYMQAITQQIQQDVSISLAVVGELHLEPSLTDAQGTTSTCKSNITVFYHNADGTLRSIGSFTDTYTLRRPLREDAEKLVLQKAAYNSAKYLSHLTLSFWETHK